MKCGIVTNPNELQTIQLRTSALDIAGEIYGRLTVSRPVGRDKKGTMWLCLCSCGNNVITRVTSLHEGKRTSCGCNKREVLSAMCKERNYRGENSTTTVDGSIEILLVARNLEVVGRAYIDEDDRALLSFRWWMTSNGYVATTLANGKNVHLHRMVAKSAGMVVPSGQCLDHIDANRLNNRRSNLRVATRSDNSAHRTTVAAKSGYKGVCFHSGRQTWDAEINKDYHKYYLGAFQTPELAAQAYNSAALRLFGEYAHLNVIPDEVL